MSRRPIRTGFLHFALSVAALSCALNDPPLVDRLPSTPDGGPSQPSQPRPPRADGGGTRDAGPAIPDELPTGCVSGATRPCGPPTELGECTLGTRVCVDGVWGECLGAVHPGERICGGRADVDCDGQPDDTTDAVCECVPGTSEPCDTHPGLDGVGSCKAGLRNCEASRDGKTSRWGACTGSLGPAATDSCLVLGDDANCDGTPNSGCECVEGVELECGPLVEQGICKKGKSTCVNSKYTECAGAVLPRARNCSSSVDNDCNGTPDNAIDAFCTCTVGATEPCNTERDGVGVCRAGTRTCVAGSGGSTSAWGACVGSVGPSPRRCDSSADNDCNGTPDDADTSCTCAVGTTRPCQTHPGLDGVGRCRAGEELCVASADNTSSAFSGVCTGSVGPLPADSCTVLNDDSTCDGELNGGCACVAGQGNGPCSSDPAASRCDATGACVPCAANADCSLVSGRPLCSAGLCVQCLTDAQCGAGNVCNTTTHACEEGPPVPDVDAGN